MLSITDCKAMAKVVTPTHLQEEVELSALAQDLVRLDKMSAAAWYPIKLHHTESVCFLCFLITIFSRCATGNCFSHQKEHENAIKFFQRAVQVGQNKIK